MQKRIIVGRFIEKSWNNLQWNISPLRVFLLFCFFTYSLKFSLLSRNAFLNLKNKFFSSSFPPHLLGFMQIGSWLYTWNQAEDFVSFFCFFLLHSAILCLLLAALISFLHYNRPKGARAACNSTVYCSLFSYLLHFCCCCSWVFSSFSPQLQQNVQTILFCQPTRCSGYSGASPRRSQVRRYFFLAIVCCWCCCSLFFVVCSLFFVVACLLYLFYLHFTASFKLRSLIYSFHFIFFPFSIFSST